MSEDTSRSGLDRRDLPPVRRRRGAGRRHRRPGGRPQAGAQPRGAGGRPRRGGPSPSSSGGPTAGSTCPGPPRSAAYHPDPLGHRGGRGGRLLEGDHLHLRVPQPDRPHRAGEVQPEVPRPAQRPAAVGRPVRRHQPADGEAHEPRPASCGRTCSTRTRCTGTASRTRSRTSTASPRGRSRCPPGATFTYAYRPHDPGTYMYHCHVEDVEHVHMGMTGMVFVRPAQNGNTARSTRAASTPTTTATARPATTASTRCSCRRCGPRRTGPTRTSSCPSGATTGPTSPCSTAASTRTPSRPARSSIPTPHVRRTRRTTPGGDLPPAGRPELRYQPLSSLVTCNAGERVLLRFASLGFKQETMTLDGHCDARSSGKDATMLRGRTGANAAYTTDTYHDRRRRERRRHLRGAALQRRRGSGPDTLPALQPRVPARQQPVRGRLRRAGHGDPRLPGQHAARPRRTHHDRRRSRDAGDQRERQP